MSRVVAAVCPPDARLGLAVSGGRDSIGLAAAIQEAGLAPRCELLHVHHGSGPFADQAAEAVPQHAEALGMACFVARLPIADSAARRSETRWRAARLEALASLAQARGLSWVLLAHHAADLRESVALHLSRGHRGARALSGPACLRPLSAEVTLLRPFLAEAPALEPEQLAEAARRARLPHLEDPSNVDTSIPRNSVRAWLASAAGAPWAPRLDALSAQARARLRRLRSDLIEALHDGLQPCGQGCRVTRAALRPAAGHAPLSWLAELLRVLAAALVDARQPQLTQGLLRRLLADLESERALSGSIPATPRALEYLLRADGLHLPHEALAGADPSARLLTALAALPWEAP